MASLITVRLSKGDSPSLGFRLQGGKDFGTPLVIQKVNGGSPAERAGLLAGDSVIKVNNTDVFNLRHKDAQDVIIRAGPAFELTVQRGGSVWKPSVIPTGTIHTASPTSPITKTSLVANKKENIGSIGTGHNLSAKPFSAQLNGAVNGGPKLVNNQYNSPLKLYSEESIAETLSAQTEVLSTGALGVNFKKNEKNYDASNSAVYRMLQEAEKEPKTPEAVSPRSDFYATHSHAVGGRQATSPRSNTPDDHSRLSSRLGDYPNTIPNQEGVTKCTECERVIVGVFVRIKDKNLHVECFKCSTCGTSLKNVGYYNINNKLYCDVHAKLAARTNPPAPNLVPITVPPGGKAPASAISTALATHSLPSPSPLSPKTNLAQPFQPSQDKETNLTSLQNLSINSDPNCLNKPNNLLSSATPLSYSKYLNKAGNYSTAPKPFASVSAPTSNQSFNTLPKTAPLSPIASAPAPASYSPVSSTDQANTKRSELHLQIGDSTPSYGQVNITIPLSTSPQLDSKGSSPRSDYSSQSSSSSKNPQNVDIARDKFLSELRSAEAKKNESSLHNSSPLFSHVSKPQTTKEFTRSEPDLNLPDNLTFANALTEDKAKNATPVCCQCNVEIVRGPFITALGKIWCPEHFICATPSCRRPLQDLGFVEEQGQLYCEYCFEQYLAPPCAKCSSKIKGDCLKAIGKNFHPECFNCVYCGKLFGNSPFFLEDGNPYCEADWNELFTTKCFACGFPVEAGDRWVEALNNNYHSQCFNCTMCKKNLEGQSFFAKGGRPFCKNHAR
ncbi:PDZ and LIM domain protein Zasp isoform X1 [Tribolium castaneum]|uniref:PDZ and LIM domain protein Zasp isoform X1 n=1 Tax=Tribolium castaneum TaxID=7070 RepID=UPI00077DCEAD|nr:PREDICTED: PDZ and LIM domain protein Zasp isoform X1 [Tribolium castaneum]|eukprot:XP_015835999.1 PREDICTED: PDZ and LIM domain protein Zasp isoform X1 [Tribolium castaneum]